MLTKTKGGDDDCSKCGDVVRYSTNFEILALAKVVKCTRMLKGHSRTNVKTRCENENDCKRM